MQFFWFFSLVFGGLVIAYPEFLSYIIGGFFLFLGINILIISGLFRASSRTEWKSWKIGEYEIVKNRK